MGYVKRYHSRKNKIIRLIQILLYTLTLFLFNSCSILVPFKNLPKPDGVYNIGTDVFILEDINRSEFFTTDSSDYRKIIVQAWYPSKETTDSIYPYLDYPNVRIPFIAKRMGVPKSIIKHIGDIKANAYYKAKPINKEFPVVIFSHGLGGNRTQNTANFESLASNGYIVYSIEHSYDANITIFNDSSYVEFDSYLSSDANEKKFYKVRIPQITARSQDISFLINQIELFKSQGFYIGKISNINKIGVFGHSFGGGTATLSTFKDSRIKACMNLDGWFEPIPQNVINTGIKKPFCYIGQKQSNWTTAPYNESKLFDFHNNNDNESIIIEIERTKHFDYTDIPYLSRISRLLGFSGKAGKKITLDLNKTITSYFDKYLKEKDIIWLNILRDNYNIIIHKNEK